MAGTYFIRKAETKDAEDIFKMVTSLALFDKYPTEIVTISVEDLAHYLSKNWYQCLLLNYKQETRENIVGFAVFHYCFSTWDGPMAYLEDLYILAEHRGNGHGFSLIQNVAKIASENGCRGMRWTVRRWNEIAKKLYSKIKATNATENEQAEFMELKGEHFTNLAKGRSSTPIAF